MYLKMTVASLPIATGRFWIPTQNLMWAARDNGSDIDWWNAETYFNSYRGGGFTDWRIPTLDELRSYMTAANHGNRHVPRYIFYFPSAIHFATELIDITCKLSVGIRKSQ